MKSGIEIIAQERKRHTDVEGWTTAHDAKHDKGELALAAATYALPNNIIIGDERTQKIGGVFLTIKKWVLWPFEMNWFKPTPNDRIKELAKAGALIAAEIDRLQSKINDEEVKNVAD